MMATEEDGEGEGSVTKVGTSFLDVGSLKSDVNEANPRQTGEIAFPVGNTEYANPKAEYERELFAMTILD